jgi:L-cysteine/cystine lyase
MVAPFLPEKEKLAAIRDELPATSAGIYLDTASAGPLPGGSDRAMREWADWELRVGRAGTVAEEEFTARADEARASVAAIMVAPITQVELAPSVASAVLAAAARRSWGRGKRIVVIGPLEDSLRHALAAIASLTGADLVDADPGSFPASLGDRPALVCVSHVSPVDGAVTSLAEIARAARQRGAWLVVDGSLAVGAMPVDVTTLDTDVYATAGDRWLCGPSGTAAAYISDRVGPPRSGPADAPEPDVDLHHAAVIGLGRSAGWLAMQVGLDWAHGRTRALARRTAEALASIPGVTIAGEGADASHVLAVSVAGWPGDRLREELGHRVFARVGLTPDGGALRVSVGCWNTEEEIDGFVAAVGALAKTTPDAAPRRPPILVVPGDPG